MTTKPFLSDLHRIHLVDTTDKMLFSWVRCYLRCNPNGNVREAIRQFGEEFGLTDLDEFCESSLQRQYYNNLNAFILKCPT